MTVSAGGDGSNRSAHISLLINTFDEMEDSGCTQESCLHNRKSAGAPQEIATHAKQMKVPALQRPLIPPPTAKARETIYVEEESMSSQLSPPDTLELMNPLKLRH